MNPYRLFEVLRKDYSDDVEHVQVLIEKWIPLRIDRPDAQLDDLGTQIIDVRIVRTCPRRDLFEQNVLSWDRMLVEDIKRRNER